MEGVTSKKNRPTSQPHISGAVKRGTDTPVPGGQGRALPRAPPSDKGIGVKPHPPAGFGSVNYRETWGGTTSHDVNKTAAIAGAVFIAGLFFLHSERGKPGFHPEALAVLFCIPIHQKGHRSQNQRPGVLR